MRSIKLILFAFFLGSTSIAQEINFELDYNLSQFYSEVRKENVVKAFELSNKIDSILTIGNELDTESLATYNNAKGFIYDMNSLDPEPYLIIADSLNNLLPIPNLSVRVFSSYLLGNYYYRKKMDSKAKEFYSKIIDIEDLPEKFYGYKLVALQDKFKIERIELLENNSDSTEVKETARELKTLSIQMDDTLSFSYGKAVEYIGQNKIAENIFQTIKDLPETDSRYNHYDKFLALNWLNTFYYKNINFNIDDTLNAEKLRIVSEELLSVIQDTDYMEPHNVYAVYGDIVVAGLIIKDPSLIRDYENKILDVLNQADYLSKVNFDLKRFYYTLHRLKMYFEFNKDYEKAKFYAFKNVELTKYLYGDISVEHERELWSYENIIKLKQFEYDEAFKISRVRADIIKAIFGETSIEYLDLLYQQRGIKLSQLKLDECLAISERALRLISDLNCDSIKLCNDFKIIYLQDLNANKLYERTLVEVDKFEFNNDINTQLELSSIRRYAYSELKVFMYLNLEFETTLSNVLGDLSLLKDNTQDRLVFIRFLTDYQEHLRSIGRLNKAISISEDNMEMLNRTEGSLERINFLIGYLNVLIQQENCSKALDFIDNNEILIFDEITAPATQALWKYKINFISGGIHSCLDENIKAIEAYKRALLYDKIDNTHIYSELARLYKIEGNLSESERYFNKYILSFSLIDSVTIYDLYMIVDNYIQKGQIEKTVEYLLPLSSMIIDEICEKAFFSDNDNNVDKRFHEYILKLILIINDGSIYNEELFSNAVMISNLYKHRLEYYADINLGIQKLKADGYQEAIDLQNLENEYNTRPSELLEEEIAQLKTKLISFGLLNFEWLCNTNFQEIYESIGKNELVLNVLSYRDNTSAEEHFYVDFNLSQLSLISNEVYLNDHYDLFEKDTINSDFFNYIKNEILKNEGVDGDLIDTFYIIPSGKSNLINFSAYSLKFEEELGRKIKVHIINSLTDIPKLKEEQQKKVDNLILIGDIDFDKVSGVTYSREVNLTRGIQLTRDIENSGIPQWGYLPGTKKEIEGIEKAAIKNNISTLTLSGSNVTEANLKEAIKDASKSNVVHIATHAYFFPDDISESYDNFYALHKNPFLRSGLILSGANKNWNNKTHMDPSSDGILTAEEISFMDLSGVELVVLSACNTGLGDVSNLEGINGLQRAFKLAGANKLIMSLWKVPDEETAEFFNYFYRFLLDEKFSINEAFRETQKIMKEKYAPFYWASFVLLE